MSVLRKPVVRASIYTRKSSDEGLDQEFNSLDAQHEACSAYIASQRHEGWKLIKKRFDDGGISGGTLERPALQSLLTDVGAVRLTSPSISIHLKAIFYEITKERHSVRAASRLSLNVLRFESDLCELNRL